eukprot:6285382-Pyramimonas_sp.AAC.1
MSASGEVSFRPLTSPSVQGPSSPSRGESSSSSRRVQRDLFPLPLPQSQQSVVGVARPSRR